MSRLLLDPTTTDGGNSPAIDPMNAPNAPAADLTAPAPPKMPAPLSTPAATPHPDLATPPAKPGDPPRVAPIWVAPDDWTAQQGELQKLRSFKAEADRLGEAKEQERIRLMAEKGQIEEAFKLQEANHAKKLAEYAGQAKQIETEWLGEKRVAAINEALQGRTFTGVDPAKTAKLVRSLLEQEVEAVRDDRGRPVIRDRQTLKPANEFLKERLDSEDFSIFFAATNRGGSGADASRPAATPKNPGDPNSAFAAAFLKAQEDAKNARF